MRIVTQEKLSNNFGLSIVEVDDPIARQNFENRFQIVVEVDDKKIFPREKNKFLSFKEKNYFYQIMSDKTNKPVLVNEVLYHEKQMCDKSYEECSVVLNKYFFMYHNGIDLKLELKRLYKF